MGQPGAGRPSFANPTSPRLRRTIGLRRAGQQRLAQLLLEQVVVHTDRIEVALRADGLDSLMAELHPTDVGHGA